MSNGSLITFGVVIRPAMRKVEVSIYHHTPLEFLLVNLFLSLFLLEFVYENEFLFLFFIINLHEFKFFDLFG